jgi:hypothetical protein
VVAAVLPRRRLVAAALIAVAITAGSSFLT